jgi:hypothetical protein
MIDEIIAGERGSSKDSKFVVPVITQPSTGGDKYGVVSIYAYYAFPHSKWKIEFFTAKGMSQEVIVDGSGDLSYSIANEVPVNTEFYLKLSCLSGSSWSPTASSNWMKIIIRPPSFWHYGLEVPDRPIISLWGYPGATIRLYEAGSGVVLYGTGIVGSNGQAHVRVTEKMHVGDFYMTCNQTIDEVESGWADDNLFKVKDVKLKITPPVSEVSQKPRVTGVGHPGSIIKLYQAGWGGVVHGSGKVEDSNGNWIIDVTENLPVGEFPMTASETLDGVEYGYADTVMFSVRASIVDDHSAEAK